MQAAYKIVAIVVAVAMCIGSLLVTIAALWRPRKNRGNGRSDVWDESIEDV